MKTNHKTDHLIQQTFDSLEGMQKASPGPYFFTRVQARLYKSSTDIWDVTLSYLSRPSVVITCIILIVMLDIMAFAHILPGEASTADQAAAVADEYNMAVATIYEYDKPR